MSPLHRYEKLELTESVAFLAGDLSHELKLGLADAIILAHARTKKLPLLTLDNDFAEITDAKVLG